MVSDWNYFGTSVRIAKGDKVRLTDVPVPLKATVDEIIAAKSESSKRLGIYESGGIVLRAESGEEFIWTEIDSHLEFLGRQGQG